MIIIKYLAKEAFKYQIAILAVLLLVFFCQRLINILHSVVNGEIPIHMLFSLTGLGMSEIARCILPLSVCLSLLITFGKLYKEGEITIIYNCGLSKIVLIKSAMIVACFTGSIAITNIIWVGPLFAYYKSKIIKENNVFSGMTIIPKGKFQNIPNTNLVLFIEDIKDNNFNGIFLANLCQKCNFYPSVIVAQHGKHIIRKDGSQIVILHEGTCFEGIMPIYDFRITHFKVHQITLGYKDFPLYPNNVESMSIKKLWKTNTNPARAELHWRMTLVFIIFIIALIVVPLSEINLRKEYTFSVLISVLLYLIFFLLQTFIKSLAEKDKINPGLWMWIVNGGYVILAIILNLYDLILLYQIRKFLKK